MKQSTKSRVLSLILVLAMVLSMMPASVFAAETTATWSKVELADITADDTIAITMTSGNTTWVLPNTGAGNKKQPLAETATVTADTLTTASSSAYSWTVTAVDNGYTIMTGSSYLYLTANNNGMRIGATKMVWTLSEDGYLTANDSSSTARYLGVYNGTDWRCYTSTSTNIAGQTLSFWKLNAADNSDTTTVATPTPSIPAGVVESGTEVEFSCGTADSTIYYKTTSDGEYTEYTGELIVNETTTFTVYATAEGMTESPHVTFTYLVPVSIETALAATEGSFAVKGIVTMIAGKNVHIQDETGGINLYCSANAQGISVGDTVIGSGSRSTYSQLPQLTSATFTKSEGPTLTVKETTIGALTNADLCTYVSIEGLTVTKIDGSKITVSDGTDSIDIFNAVTDGSISVGDIVHFQGALSTYNGFQLRNTSADEISVVLKAPTAEPAAGAVVSGTKVEFSCATEGAKIFFKTTGEYQEYTAPIEITEATTFSVYAQKDNLQSGKVEFAYTIKEEGDTPVDPAGPLADGDMVVIYNPANMKALSSNYDGHYNSGVDVRLSEGVLSGFTAAEVWTVGLNDDGSYTFSNADGKKLSMAEQFASMPLDGVYTNWTVTEAATADCYYIQNIGRNSYVEWYADKGNWSSYYSKSNEALFAQAFYQVTELPDDPVSNLPADGDKVVIYNLSAAGVLAAESDSQTINSASATVEEGIATPANGGVVVTVSKNGDYYRFHNETYGYLCSNGTGNNAFYSKDASEDADWTLTNGKSGGFFLESRTAKYGTNKYSQYLEYYGDSYKTYSMYNVTDYNIYEFFFYPVAEGVNLTDGIVNVPAVDFGTLYDAYAGTPYTFTFTVDTVFGIDGGLTVQAGEETLSANNDGSYTVPTELITGERLSITVTGVDTKGVAISGSATVTVKDEPVIGIVTPAANDQTGDNKKPVISAQVFNAGENAEITMTVTTSGSNVLEPADLEIGADGLVCYTPEADLPDGHTTVTLTVKRLTDGKEVTKTWSFTVGNAQYQLYFGQLHSHTTYSDGSGTLDSALEYIAGLPESANVDFVAFTDHSNYFDKSGAANPEDALYDTDKATAFSKETWAAYKDTIAEFNASQDGVIAIGGYEMTWSGGPGHMNTFNTPGIVSRNNSTLNNKTDDAGMKAYYALLSRAEGVDSISQFNHPGSTFGTFSDFAYQDAVIDSRIHLVEVGNGEGQIGAGGYYPSYEYYTMALDKGWHVAPTNNQDNHKGKWGNANDARDVVLTDNFTEEGIYEAIRQMRVYATEDKNLAIQYSVNGQMLGSSISEIPEKLNFNITVFDPDTADSISKVELIVNSGKVAHTWSDPADLADGALEATLDPTYSYYYVRVTQADGDLAVTAPVWVGESLKLGISGVVCGTPTPVTGEELTITTTLFNSEATEAAVKSIVYTVGDKVLATDTTGYTIPTSGTLDVEFQYIPETARIMDITATAVVELDGEEYTFSMDVNLDIQDADKLVYVGIDASHYNEYVDGNYKDSMGNFGALAATYSVRTVELKTSEDLIAACSNPKYKAMILTAPSRRNGSALRDPYATYSDTEIAALKSFNANDGILILTGWGDYYESYSSFPAEDHMAAQQNKLLAALGSSLRVADDETKDNTHNGGQPQRLYLSVYDFNNFLLDGVEYDAEHPHDNMYTELYSQYGGASIYVVDESGAPTASIPSTVTPAVYGFETTYSADDDDDNFGGLGQTQKYSVGTTQNLMVMATEQMPDRGLIVVAGAAFLSNFEVQAEIKDSGAEKNYANYKICENLLSYINPVTISKISEVQAQENEGVKYTIEGVVTSNASGYDKATAFFDCIYLQDETAGINAFPVAGNFKIGDKVRITGTTSSYNGERQIAVANIELISEGSAVAPAEITAAQLNNGSMLGSLITLKGSVKRFELANGLVQTILVEDAEGNTARIFIDGYITTDEDVQNLAVGNDITVTGLASYDNSFDGTAPRIRVRDRGDVVCTAPVHKHAIETHVEFRDATCTEDGTKEHWICLCGTIFADEALTQVVADPDALVLPATGHDCVKGDTVPATCVTDGYTEYQCQNENCGYSYRDSFVPALEHDTTSKVVAPTHNAMGYTVTSCTREGCGYSYVHSFVDALEHKYTKTVTKEATCTAEGLWTFTCDCGETYTQAIPMTGHSCTATITAPTCTEDGFTTYECSAEGCGYSYTAQPTKALGHDLRDAVCMGNGYQVTACHRCDYEWKESHTCPTSQYSDLLTAAWYHEATDYILSEKIMIGTGEGIFSPDGSLTRGQIVTILYRLAGEPEAEQAAPFTDVAETAYYADAAAWGYESGIVKGISETEFAPDQAVTREQMATFLHRYAGKPEAPKDAVKGFTDADQISGYALDAMNWVVGNGILNGTSNTTLSPSSDTARVQTATIIYRYLEAE